LLKLHKVKKFFRKLIFLTITMLLLFILINSFLQSNFKKYRADTPAFNSITYISEESLIKKINGVNKLITLELELSQMAIIDKSLGDLDFLKKYKRIKFFADCSYHIDLSKIGEEDITINPEEKTLSITVPKPDIYNISINEDKTIFEESQNGFLRFGEVKLSTEEFNSLQNEVLTNFEEKLKRDEIYEEALNKSKISIEELLSSLIKEEVEIKIYFK